MANLIALPHVSEAELATILHGLRVIQESKNTPGECVAGGCDHFADVIEITDLQIDNLCERLNFDSTREPKLL
jgi:hypothetical protein